MGVSMETHQQDLYPQYDTALRRIYDELYELNVTQDAYRIVYHVEGKYVTPAAEGRLSDGVRQVAEEMIHPGDRARFLQFLDLGSLRGTFEGGQDSLLGEFRKLWQDGQYHWASLTIFPMTPAPCGEEVYLCFIMDIEEKKRAEEIEEQNRALKKQNLDDERYRIIVEQTGAIVFEWNLEAGERFLSPKLPQVLAGKYDGRDLFRVWREDGVVHPEDLETLRELAEKRDGGGAYREATVRLKNRKGDYFWCKLALTGLRDEQGRLKRVVGTVNDVDEAVRSRLALKYRAEYDMLTGILNAEGFYSGARRLMREHPDRQFAVVRMDINRFKFINDLYGLEEGDRLLRFIAGLLREAVGDGGVCGRLNGDVFGLCVPYESQRELGALADSIADRLGGYGLGYAAVPSFGICAVDDREMPVSILCDWANLALGTVKGSLLRRWAFYDDKLRARQLEERVIEREMRDALERGEFVVYLQPKHEITSGRITGAEALVRWAHPREGLLAPCRFIPLFERNGFIAKLDEYVWERTCGLLRSWIDRGWRPLPLSMNVSRIHAYNPGFEEKLERLIQTYRLPSSLIELELTESTFVENPERLYHTMEQLQEKGFVFSMDDFGSGYSSLNMLKDVPVNAIKLDRGFLNETAVTAKGQTVIRNTIAMARQLDLRVVAEGVETERQAAFLADSGCGTAQGFYFSRPMPADRFEELAFGAG